MQSQNFEFRDFPINRKSCGDHGDVKQLCSDFTPGLQHFRPYNPITTWYWLVERFWQTVFRNVSGNLPKSCRLLRCLSASCNNLVLTGQHENMSEISLNSFSCFRFCGENAWKKSGDCYDDGGGRTDDGSSLPYRDRSRKNLFRDKEKMSVKQLHSHEFLWDLHVVVEFQSMFM